MLEYLISVTPLVVIGTLMLSAMVVGILALQEHSRPRTEQPMHLEDVDKEIIESWHRKYLKVLLVMAKQGNRLWGLFMVRSRAE